MMVSAMGKNKAGNRKILREVKYYIKVRERINREGIWEKTHPKEMVISRRIPSIPGKGNKRVCPGMTALLECSKSGKEAVMVKQNEWEGGW